MVDSQAKLFNRFLYKSHKNIAASSIIRYTYKHTVAGICIAIGTYIINIFYNQVQNDGTPGAILRRVKESTTERFVDNPAD